MHPIIYDVAVSIDGFIAGPSEDVSQFPHSGKIVEDYQTRLQSYKTCFMGRKTYEFGYRFGLKPGKNPYPWMRSIVISESLVLPSNSKVESLTCVTTETIKDIAKHSAGPIYLCGGGELAGWMLETKLIDQLRIKRAPILLGSGVPLFGNVEKFARLTQSKIVDYGNGEIFQEFMVEY